MQKLGKIHHAGTEHTGRKPSLEASYPCGTEGNTHNEHGTRNTQEECHNKQHGQRVHLTSNTNQEDQGALIARTAVNIIRPP